VRVPGKPVAELMAPGHPLLDAVLDITLERHRRVLTQGAVLVDERDLGTEPRVLVLLEHAIADGRPDGRGAGRRVVSRQMQFVDLRPDGTYGSSDAAPYLDFHGADASQRAEAEKLLTGSGWLAGDLEAAAFDVAVTDAIPAHLARTRLRTTTRVHKVRAAVHERLTREINHWDHRANELDAQVQSGKQPKMNPDRARQRADDLAGRLKRRMDDLAQQEELHALPPSVTGAALVLPAGLLQPATVADVATRARETARVERRAVDAVLAAEDALGRTPREMAHNNPGYDIASTTADGHLLFIEVKGRIAGAETVTITRNEILTSLNTDRWVLALVAVTDDAAGRPADVARYLHHPFRGQLDDLGFKETSRTFGWKPLWEAAGDPV
jgi:hypothetical protein